MSGSLPAWPRSGPHRAARRALRGPPTRFPLQPQNAEAGRWRLEAEADAARELADRTRFPTPEPVAIGEPGHGYPLP